MSVSPLLQSMIDGNAAGASYTSPAQPVSQPVIQPVQPANYAPVEPPKMQKPPEADTVNIKNKKGSLPKRLIKGAGIGGGVGFLGTFGALTGAQKSIEWASKQQGVNGLFGTIFGAMENIAGEDVIGELAKQMGENGEQLKEAIATNSEEAGKKISGFMVDIIKQEKLKTSLKSAGKLALVGLAIGGVVHIVKSAKAKAIKDIKENKEI